jgi:hypothetical protein
MLIEYLITSKARRRLLTAICAKRAVGSVSELAREAKVVTSVAHREVAKMELLRLVVVDRSGSAKRVRANGASPHMPLLRRLLVEGSRIRQGEMNEGDDTVRRCLVAYGAPLSGSPKRQRLPALEGVIAEALELSHRDATVARTLPVLLWRNRKNLRMDELVRRAERSGQTQTLGFFLDLTGELSREESWAAAAALLRDRRFRRPVYFFDGADRSEFTAEAAERNTPEVARRWNFRMNMPLDSFSSMFRKALALDVPPPTG